MKKITYNCHFDENFLFELETLKITKSFALGLKDLSLVASAGRIIYFQLFLLSMLRDACCPQSLDEKKAFLL